MILSLPKSIKANPFPGVKSFTKEVKNAMKSSQDMKASIEASPLQSNTTNDYIFNFEALEQLQKFFYPETAAKASASNSDLPDFLKEIENIVLDEAQKAKEIKNSFRYGFYEFLAFLGFTSYKDGLDIAINIHLQNTLSIITSDSLQGLANTMSSFPNGKIDQQQLNYYAAQQLVWYCSYC